MSSRRVALAKPAVSNRVSAARSSALKWFSLDWTQSRTSSYGGRGPAADDEPPGWPWSSSPRARYAWCSTRNRRVNSGVAWTARWISARSVNVPPNSGSANASRSSCVRRRSSPSPK